MNSLIKSYAELKSQIKILEDEAENLKPQVLAAMESGALDTAEITGVGHLTLGTLRKWTYPQAIVQAEADLKVAKKTAEQTGDATATESKYVKFTVLKEIDADA